MCDGMRGFEPCAGTDKCQCTLHLRCRSLEDENAALRTELEGTKIKASVMTGVACKLGEHFQKLDKEHKALLRGEFICKKCGLRKDSDLVVKPEF